MKQSTWTDRLTFSVGLHKMNFCEVQQEYHVTQPFADHTAELHVEQATFSVTTRFKHTDTRYDGRVSFHVTDGALGCATAALRFDFADWDPETYVMLPGCAYRANRFSTLDYTYPPFYPKQEWGKHPKEFVVEDILQLNPQAGRSVLHCLSGDMSTPAFCLFDAVRQCGMILLFEQSAGDLPNTGVRLEENDQRDHLCLTLTFPGECKAVVPDGV